MCKYKKPRASIMRCLSLSVLLTAAWGLNLTSAIAQPANDNFANARVLVGGTGTITGNNVNAGAESGEINHGGGGGSASASVWFIWTAATDAIITFDTIGSDFDTVLSIYDGTGISSVADLSAALGSNDDLNSAAFGRRSLNGASGVSISVTAGTTYYIALDGFNGEMGKFTLNRSRGGERSAGEFEFTSATYFGTVEESVLDHSDQNGNQGVNRDVPGVLITVTRKNGSSGKVLVNYETQDILPGGAVPAVADFDYAATSGTLVFEDFQMSANFIVPIIPPQFPGDPGTFFKAFNVVLLDASLAIDVSGLEESTDLVNPIISSEHGVAEVLIAAANPFPQGVREDNPDIEDEAGSIQFERAHYRRTEGVGTARIRVVRTGGTAAQQDASVTVQYHINRSSNNDLRSAFNVFPLSAGSDYARPDTEVNGDYLVNEPSIQTLTIPANPPFAYIDVPITEDDLAEFNEDILIQLISNNGSPAPRITNPTATAASTGYGVGFQSIAILTLMYDDYPAGALDAAHNPDFDPNTNPPRNATPGTDGSVYSVAIQPDGKTVLAGSFTTYNSVDRKRIARMNADGSLDTSFNPGSGANNFITSIQRSGDGRLVVGGAFSSFNNVSRNSIARLNANGSLDESFNVGAGANGTVWAVALQADGKVLIGGEFTFINAVSRNRIARLNADGTVDLSFNPGIGPDGTVFSIAMGPGGSILIGGEFTSVNGSSRNSIARLNADGSHDTLFDPGTGADDTVYSLVVQPNGRILVGGAFSEFASTSRNSIARLLANGSLDTSFECGTGANDTIYTIALQSNGKILVGGLFTSINGTRRMGVARLFAHGPVDTSFLDTAYNHFAGLVNSYDNVNINPANYLFAIGVQQDGNVIIGGGFNKVGGGRGSREVRPEQFDANEANYLDDLTRATYRVRHNIARLLGGETPGPGNIEFASDTFAIDQGASQFFVPLVRTNYTADTNYLGAITANFVTRTLSDGSGAASEDDFSLNAKYGNPRWGSSWNRTNKLAFTRMQSDGFFGENSATLPFSDTYNNNDIIPLEGEAFVFLDIKSNSLLQGDKKLRMELTRPKGARIRDNSRLQSAVFYFDAPLPAHTDQNLEWSLGGEFIPLGTALGRSSAELTIIDRRPKNGELNFSAPEYVVNENGINAQVVVTRSKGSQGIVSVQYATADGTNSNAAIKNQDYQPVSGTLQFSDGVTNRTISIPIINDSGVEPDEIFTVRIFNPTLGATLGARASADIKIIDDDYEPGRLSFTNLNVFVDENGGNAVIAVTRLGGSRGTVSVQYSTYPGGSATENEDYIGVANTLTWNGGETSVKTFLVPILNDNQIESDETVFVRLTEGKVNGNPSSLVLGSITNLSLTIRDDDRYGSFSFSSPQYYENENSGSTPITIIRTAGTSGAVNLILNGRTNNVSFLNIPVSFAPQEFTKTILIPINDNFDLNPNLTVNLSLTDLSPAAAVLGTPSTAQLIIYDNESNNEPPGSIDATFNPPQGLNDYVYALAIQPDQKILVAGDFTVANAVSRNRIARLNLNGTTDTQFSTSAGGANGSVRSLVIQSDNRILIGGLFTSVNGVNLNRIARLNNDGTSDSTFDPGAGANNPVYAVAETFVIDANFLEDRRVLAVGAFTTFDGKSRSGIVRLHNDGTVDDAFNPGNGVNGTNSPIRCLAVQGDGKVIIGGDFVSFNNVSTPRISRLNVDGSVDTTFNPGIGPNASVRALAIQADGKIVIGGLFTNVSGTSFNYVARLEANGTVDSTFVPGLGANDSVYAIALQPDGRILLGGEFTQANGVSRNRLARLNSNGTIDTGINFGTGANSFVTALGIDRSGRIILGGGFTQFNGVNRPHIARIYGRSSGNTTGRIEFSSANFEANENGTTAVITVLRKGGTTGTVSIDVNTSDATAINGVDYTGVSTTLVFPPGETLQTITIPIIDNNFVEADKTVRLALSNTTADEQGDQETATLTIRNDDAAISFSSSTYIVAENTVSGTAVIEVRRTGSSIGIASVDFTTTTNGTATPDLDYGPITNSILFTNTIFFAEGETSQTVSISLVNDTAIEGDETVTMELSNAQGAILVAPFAATLTIVDDDFGPGNIAFAQTNYSVGEGAGSAIISLVRTNGSQGFVSVNYSAGGFGTATSGLDYVPTNGVVTFGPGELSKTFSVRILEDNLSEGSETLTLALSNPTGGATIVGTNSISLTIVDNDIAFAFSTPAYVIGEGDSGVTITVRRLGGSNGVASVFYQTADGTATNGLDYIGRTNTASTTNTLVFADGELFKTFTIPILEDALVEGDETFFVSIFGPSGGAQLGSPSTAVVTIVDNDSSLSFSTAEFIVEEGGTNALITVVRTNTSSGTVSVNFATSNGTAVSGSDYRATNGTLTFLDGESSKTISIAILEDTLVENNETFTVRLTNVTGTAVLGTPSIATVTILDNDAGLRFSSPVYSVSESGVSAAITVLRTTVTNTTVSVNYSAINGTATDGLDFIGQLGTLTFTNGETTKTFNIAIIDDTTIEGDETVLLSLFSPSGQATVTTPGAAVLTIVDNDGSLIVPAGSTLTFESLNANNIIEPSETVTLLFAFRNTVGVNTTDLRATLLAGDGVTAPSGQQSYGVLNVNGASVSRPFSFTASGTNGQRITATLQLTDGPLDLGTGTFTYTLGQTSVGFTNSTPITINDSSAPPTLASAYPSTINVSGVQGSVSKVTLTLSNLSHTFPDDIDMLLVSPTGQKIVLMSDAGGGSAITNRIVTFDDSATGSLPDSSVISSGTFRPTNYLPGDAYPVPAPDGPYSATLSVLNGTNPNGVWSLFIVDDTFFNSGRIGGWSLAISTANGVTPTADLSLAMSASPSPAATNNPLTYTITVTNHGPSTATGIVISNTLPAGAAYVSDTCDCSINENILLYPVPTLAKDGVVSFTVVVNPTTTGEIINLASVRANENDPNLLNNSAFTATEVDLPRADLGITMSDSPDPVQINSNLTYTVVAQNFGPTTAENVFVTNALPPNTVFVSATVPSGTFTNNNGTLVFNLGNVAGPTPQNPTSIRTITVVIRPTLGGTITNTVVVSSSVEDPFKANNTASVKTFVALPPFSLARTESGLAIEWGTNAPGYVLETTTNLTEPAVWTPVTNSPVVIHDGKNRSMIDLSTGSRFFRLNLASP